MKIICYLRLQEVHPLLPDNDAGKQIREAGVIGGMQPYVSEHLTY